MQYPSHTQALANLDAAYHTQFEEIQRTFLARDERILATANCTWGQYFGFFLATSFRVIRVAYVNSDKWIERRRHIEFSREGGGFFSQTAPSVKWWFILPLSPLSAKEIKSRDIQDVPFAKLHSVTRREFKPIQAGDTSVRPLELTFLADLGSHDISYTVFDYTHGQTIYELTVNAIQSGGRIVTDTNDTGGVSEIERLAQLRREGMLSEEEFVAAKRKLLGLS